MNRYFYIDSEGKQKGTFSPEELKTENIKKDTLVWTQGMSEWKRAEEVAELNYVFAPIPVAEPAYAPHPQQQQPPVMQQPTYYARQQQPTQPMPKTWLVESILATILPFILCSSFLSLLGIIGIVNASKVESLFARGDYQGSLEASRQAAKWTKIALWISVAWIALLILCIILIFVFAGSMAGLSDAFGGSGYEI